MTESFLTDGHKASAARRAAFRPVLALLTGFLWVSAAMLAVLITLAATGASVEIAIWIRCWLVLGSAVVLLLIGRSAVRGSRDSLVRLWIIAPVVLAAIVVIVSLPGFLPGWVRIEQAICGAFVLPVVILILRPGVRALFPRRDADASSAPRPKLET